MPGVLGASLSGVRPDFGRASEIRPIAGIRDHDLAVLTAAQRVLGLAA
jgi:hypothetical protein